MKSNAVIKSLFPQLSPIQLEQLKYLGPLYSTWNQKINLISRKDIEHLYTKHILHSLMIGKWISFKKGSEVLDVGTGGGFPGIPLAILFPDVQFHLVDSTRKKINVVSAIASELQLENIQTSHQRVEELKGVFDFVLARAVAKINVIRGWTLHLIKSKQINSIPNGWILLKGGDLNKEIEELPRGSYFEKVSLSQYCDDDYFDEKYLIYLQA